MFIVKGCSHLDKLLLPPYFLLDEPHPPQCRSRPATDARRRELAAERRQDEAAVLVEAVALLDSVVDIGSPDIADDRRRLENFRRTCEAIPLCDVKVWVESWSTDKELPRPKPMAV